MGTFNINSAAYINQPIDVVGDYSIGIGNRSIGNVLTLAMFTTLTTPVYSDPEGDAVSHVRIDTLPTEGTLYLDGIAVTANQVIEVADINSNLLTYDSPLKTFETTDSLTFSLIDAGSGSISTDDGTLTIISASDLYAVSLGFDITSGDACTNFGTDPFNWYIINGTTFATATALYSDEIGTIALSGFYSDGTNWREWDNGTETFISSGSC